MEAQDVEREEMTTNLPIAYSMTDLEKMAASIVKSRLFGVENVDQAVTLMLVAQAEGVHPATAARDYHVIQGRPSMKADAMMARFQQAGGKVEWQEYSDDKVSGLFSHPQSPKPVLIEWTIEQAKRIGLAGKDNWKKYPRQMLRARVISEGVRTTYPAISSGIYASEEVQDFEPRGVQGAVADITGKQRAVVAETAAQIRAAFAEDRAWDAYQLLESIPSGDERTALWSMLDSKIRASLTTMQDAEKGQTSNVISEAQHKRLEARIREMKFSRDDLKAYCKDNFGKDHFPELTQEEYRDVDLFLDAQGSAPPVKAASPAADPSLSPGGTDSVSESQAKFLKAAAQEAAEWGTKHYQDWWTERTKPEKQAIGKDEHDRLKAVAAEADAKESA